MKASIILFACAMSLVVSCGSQKKAKIDGWPVDYPALTLFASQLYWKELNNRSENVRVQEVEEIAEQLGVKDFCVGWFPLVGKNGIGIEVYKRTSAGKIWSVTIRGGEKSDSEIRLIGSESELISGFDSRIVKFKSQ